MTLISSLEQTLREEVLERRRQEHKARRLRGALQHLLADGGALECADTGPAPDSSRVTEERQGREAAGLESLGPSSSVDPSEQLRGGVSNGPPGDSDGTIDHGFKVPGTRETAGFSRVG